MTDNMAKINIEEIMGEIRAQIKREQLEGMNVDQIMNEIRNQVSNTAPEPVPAFDGITTAVPAAIQQPVDSRMIRMIGVDSSLVNQLVNETRFVKGAYFIPYYRDPGKGPKAFIKRVIRKLIKFVVLPINEEQNAFNLHVANGIDASRAYFQAVEEQMQDLYDRLEGRLSENYQTVQEQMQDLYDRLEGRLSENYQTVQEQIQDLNDRLEGQWSAIELLQEQADAMEAQMQDLLEEGAVEDRLRQLEAIITAMRTQLSEHEKAIRKQRQEQFVSSDKLRILQEEMKKRIQRTLSTTEGV